MPVLVKFQKDSQSKLAGKYNHNKMALLKVDLHFNEAFIKPIHGLYKEYIVTVDGFKENNAELLKG